MSNFSQSVTNVGLMLLILVGVSACKFESVTPPAATSELEGRWVSDACALGLRSESVFVGNTFRVDLVSHTDLTCKTEKSRGTLLQGTFEIGAAASAPAGAKNLNLMASNGKIIYTVYKLSGDSLDFLINNAAPKDGSSEANRIDVLSGSPSTRK